ncbi:ATP synthase F1 subunit delta [bacterium]|nr:ATP synthase F1 subunit delta [bacterium]
MNNATEYAKALYELMNSVSTKEEFLKDLNETLKVFSGDTLKFFLYPEIEKEKKKDVIKASFKEGLLRDFLFVLIDNDRISLLEEIKDEFESMLDEEKKLKQVIVYSKEKLDDNYLKKLKDILEKKLSKKLILENVIDESIISGIKISYDSKEIDLTLNAKFKDLVDKLKE